MEADELASLRAGIRRASHQVNEAVASFPPAEHHGNCFGKAVKLVTCFLNGDPVRDGEKVSPLTFLDAIPSLNHRHDDPDGRLSLLLTAGAYLLEVVENAEKHAPWVRAALKPETRSPWLFEAERWLERFQEVMRQFSGGRRS